MTATQSLLFTMKKEHEYFENYVSKKYLCFISHASAKRIKAISYVANSAQLVKTKWMVLTHVAPQAAMTFVKGAGSLL